jgi:sugar phosphate isomerase/epimerase
VQFAHEAWENYEQVGIELRPLVQAAAKLGIELSLEMFENGVLDRSDHVLAILEAAEPEKVGANPDLGNLLRSPWSLPESWERTVEKLAPRINYWHVKNGLRIPLPDLQWPARHRTLRRRRNRSSQDRTRVPRTTHG